MSVVAPSAVLPQADAEFPLGLPVALSSLLGCALGIIGLSLYTLPFFIAPLSAEFGWSRGAIPIAATFLTVVIALTGPVIGRACDRIGVRVLIPVSIVLCSLCYVGLTRIGGSIWTLYVGYALLAAVGGGTTYGVYGRAVSTWFNKRRGFALGLMMAGPACMAMTVPFFLPPIIAAYGWRTGFFTLGMLALIPLPFALLFVREKGSASGVRVAHTGFALSQSIRTRRFWTLFLGVACVSCGIIATHLHMVLMLQQMGASPGRIIEAASLFGAGMLAGRLCTGLLVDHLPGSVVASCYFAAPAFGLVILAIGGPAWSVLFALLLGVASGGESDLVGYLISRYFGLRAYAETFAWQFGALSIGGAAGPLITNALLARYGDYRAPLIVSALLCLIGSILYATLGRYPTAQELQQADTGK